MHKYFSMLNYTDQIINKYNIKDESEWENILPQALVVTADQTQNFPLEIFFQYYSS